MKIGSKILFISLLVFPIAASAQFTKGSNFIGGYVSYRMIARPDNSSYQSNSVGIAPTLGFVVRDNIALGLDLGVSYGHYENTSFNTDYKSFLVGLAVAKYLPLADKFWFSITGRVGYSRSYADPPTAGSVINGDHYEISVSARPGFLFFPTSKWAVTMSIGSLGFSHLHAIASNVTENQVGFDLGSFGFGVLYFF